PVDHRPAEQRVEVLRHGGVHPRAEAAGHENCGEVLHVERRLLGRQDSNLGSRDQNPLPYRLATPHRARTAYFGRSVKRKISAAIASSAITPNAIAFRTARASGTQRTSNCDTAKIQPASRRVSERLPRATYHQKPTAITARRTATH